MLLLILALSAVGCQAGLKDRAAKTKPAMPPVIQKAPTPADSALYELALSKAVAWQTDAMLVGIASIREPDEQALDGRAYFWRLDFFSPGMKRSMSLLLTNYDVADVIYAPSADVPLSSRIDCSNWRVSSAEAVQVASLHGMADYLAGNRQAYAEYSLKYEDRWHRAVWTITLSGDPRTGMAVDAVSGRILSRMKWRSK